MHCIHIRDVCKRHKSINISVIHVCLYNLQVVREYQMILLWQFIFYTSCKLTVS